MPSTSSESTLDPRKLPQILEGPPARGQVLVMAPHADDETIGPGGTLLLHQEQGDPVDVLFLTRGTAGNADGRYGGEEYVQLRREEARAAGRILGVREIFFWDYPDNHEVNEEDMSVLVPRLVELLEDGSYDVLYTPHHGELHSDHHVSAVMAGRAVASLERPPEVFGYEVWAPLDADVVVDVTRVFPKKLEAARCYASQLALNDITRLFKCLNGYRSILLDDKSGYGEAFKRMGDRP
jgi:LmbE family N-acetylglucosaminyl deacetylase